MMLLRLSTVVTFLAWSSTGAFTLSTNARATSRATTAVLQASPKELLADVGYTVTVSKPLGVIFGENPAPMYGLVVDDVELGLAGGAAGLRVGDQLVAINDDVVIGDGFDAVMNLLRNSPDPLELQLYRGNAKSLFTIVQNRDAFAEDDSAEQVVMDENYESPVKIDVSQYQQNDEPLTPGDVWKAMQKIGSSLGEAAQAAPKEEKKGGLFGGMFGGGETIQLDGDDATSLK